MEVFPQIKEGESDSLRSLVHTVFAKRLYLAVIVASVATCMPIYAASQLSDAELDTKFLDVPIKSPSLSQSETDSGLSANRGASADATTVFEKAQLALNQSADLSGANPLLAGLEQKIRLLGTSETLGVPTGVANTAMYIPFGAENFSYKWAGNLDQVYVAPPTNIEYLQTIYGAEADFYLTKPQVVRIEATSHRTN